MRDILFKAKRKDNGKWTAGYYYKIWGKHYILWGMTNDKPDMLEIIPETLCQYTENTDMYCNNIWENDIVKYDDEYGCVEWQESAFTVVLNGWQMNLGEFNDFDLEVYGNVFDNPELLEVEE